MHIYAFGSICRGEYFQNSDIDLLVCIEKDAKHEFSHKKFSIYDYSRLQELWQEGNPFAWHLFLESKLIYSSDGKNYLGNLGMPKKYGNFSFDFAKFENLFLLSVDGLNCNNSEIFNLACIFLSLRNIATCYSLYVGSPVFSRYSPYLIDIPIELDESLFKILENARILSTRGVGNAITQYEIDKVRRNIHLIHDWIRKFEKFL